MNPPIDEELLTQTLANFAHALVGRVDVSDLLYEVAEDLVRILDLGGAGIGLADAEGVLHPVTGINQLSMTIEAGEEVLREGPCCDAFRRGEVVMVGDLEQMAGSWPRWSPDALRLGVKAVLCAPLWVRDSRLGAINMYGDAVRRWTDDELRVARLLADMTASYVAHRWEIETTRRTNEQLQHALDSRIVIEQAKGVLASHLECSVDRAFAVLRDHARRNSASLRAVANAVVHGGFRPPRGQEPAET
jgi:GAF domain-containing protein